MGCNALKIQKELIGEVLKEHFPGVSENSVLATKFVVPALFKLARHHLSAVAKVNKLDRKLKDRLLDFGINEKSNQAQAGNENKATNEKSTEIPKRDYGTNVNHTGGAYGADSIWSSILHLVGYKNVHYRPVSETPDSRTKRVNDLEAGGDIVTNVTKEENEAGSKLNTELKNTSHELNNRNYVQVHNADTVLAVAPIKDGKVQGGTGSAVRMAEALGKLIYILDTNTEEWYTSENGAYTKVTDIPKISGNIAAIGTRGLESYSKKDAKGNWSKTAQLPNSKRIVEKMKQFVLNNIQITTTKTAPKAKEEVKVDKTVVETNTNAASTKVGILNGKVGMLSKTGKSLETKVEIKSMEQLIDLAADFNTAIEEYHGREIKDESVDHMVSMFKELVSVKDFKPFTLKFDNSVEGLGLATGNSTITMTTNADAYKKVFGSPIRIVLHEYVHTITQMEMKNNPNNEVVKKIQALYDRVKNREELKGEYGLTDVYEFVAEALSNPRFQAKLDKIGSRHTLVNKIKELFKSLLTWRKDEGEVTALDEILDLAVSLKNEKLNDTGNNKQAYQAETKQEDATILDKNADKTANNLYKWAKECAK